MLIVRRVDRCWAPARPCRAPGGVAPGRSRPRIRRGVPVHAQDAGAQGVDVAALFAVRAETVSRWETGKTAVDRGAFAALAAMVTDEIGARTTTRDVLRALQRPARAPRRISLDLSHRNRG